MRRGQIRLECVDACPAEKKKKPAKEVVVVDDDQDEGEGKKEEKEEKEERANLPSTLDQGLATYSHLTRRVLTWLQLRRPRGRLKDRLWQVAARDDCGGTQVWGL